MKPNRIGCQPKPKPRPAAPAAIRHASYQNACRHECACWDILIRHTLACPACRAQYAAERQHGFGCAEGRDCRQEWFRAVESKYHLAERQREKSSCTA